LSLLQSFIGNEKREIKKLLLFLRNISGELSLGEFILNKGGGREGMRIKLDITRRKR